MSNGQEWIGRILLTNEEGLYNEDTGGRMLNLNYCDGSALDADKYPLLAEKLGGDVALPLMAAPTSSPAPYKIISDLYWYQIGDTISTGSDKIRGQSGDYEFDALLNDGSAVDPLTHPQLYAIMQTLPNDTQPAPPNQPFKTVADLT